LRPTATDPVRSWLFRGLDLLDRNQGREAADLFGRVLLRDPRNAEARRGLQRARASVDETERILDAQLDQAGRALEAGDEGRARALLDEVVSKGGDRDRAHALLDRLDTRAGSLRGLHRAETAPANAPPAGSRRPWVRHALIAAWAAAFASMAVGLGSSWNSLLVSLARTPSPTSQPGPPTTQVPVPPAGERALAEARELLDRGDAAGALAALDRVSPQEPAYPFARQLRTQAAAVLRAESRPR
jgi:FimV-like protein